MTQARVVVVGAGAFGCSAAYHLARAGASVTLIDRDGIAQHASGKNAGKLNPIHGTPPALLPLALRCYELHQELAPELAALGCGPYGLKRVDRLLLAFDAADAHELDAVQALFAEHAGFLASALGAREVLRLEPRVAANVQAGLLLEGNLSVDSAAYVRALADAAVRLGATVVQGVVHGVELRQDSVSAVRTEDAVIACDAVVFATGPWAARGLDGLGLQLPVEPLKGQMLLLRTSGDGLPLDLTRGLITLYGRGTFAIAVGVTRDRTGFDDSPTVEGRRALLEQAAAIMPSVAQAAVVEHTAALRPMTPNGLPIVGAAPGARNVLLANGGGQKGILLSAGIGRAISELVLSGSTSMPVNDFSL